MSHSKSKRELTKFTLILSKTSTYMESQMQQDKGKAMISLITRGIYIYRWLIPIPVIGKEHSHQATRKRMVSKIRKEPWDGVILNVLVFHI